MHRAISGSERLSPIDGAIVELDWLETLLAVGRKPCRLILVSITIKASQFQSLWGEVLQVG